MYLTVTNCFIFRYSITAFLLLTLMSLSVQAQNRPMTKNEMCDLQTGICGPANDSASSPAIEIIELNVPRVKMIRYVLM